MKAFAQSVLIACSVTLLATAGCAQQLPANTQADVSQAAAQGARDVATVRNEVEHRVQDAQRDLTAKEEEVRRAAAAGDRKLTVAQAEATHDVAIRRCEFQTGEARTACRNQADDALSALKASVQASKRAEVPQG
jgi:hypothetical protein